MPEIKLDNFSLFYEITGAGEPLVLIPGFASGAWIWFCQIKDLAKDFRVITFDPRGVSASPVSVETSVSIRTIADDVRSLLDELQIEKANILGASFGGFVAQEFALTYPERLHKLILACTGFGGENHVAPATEVLVAFAPTSSSNPSERVRSFMIPAFTGEFCETRGEIVEKVCELREKNIVPENIYLAQLQSATTFDAARRVAQIKAETLIISGDSDSVVPPQNSVNLANALPNAKLEIVKNGSHMFFIEKADEFNRIVKDFLKGD